MRAWVTTRKRAITAAMMPSTGISTSPEPAGDRIDAFLQEQRNGGFEDARDEEREDTEREQPAIGNEKRLEPEQRT